MYDLGVEAFLAKPPLARKELLGLIRKALAARSDLSLTPLDTVPRQSIVVEVESVAEPSFRLGRGGFGMQYPRPLGLGKVSFQCNFALEKRALIGQGFVR